MKIQPRVINAPNGGLQFAHCEVHDELHWKKFAMVVAHDLKEPLRNISSCAQDAGMHYSRLTHEEERQQLCEWLQTSSSDQFGRDVIHGLVRPCPFGRGV